MRTRVGAGEGRAGTAVGVQGNPGAQPQHHISLFIYFFFLFLKCRYLNIYTPACPTLMPLSP